MAIEGNRGGWEASIVIEGIALDFAQSTTLRGAVAQWLMELDDGEYRRDLGPIADLYRTRLGEIQALIFKNLPGPR